MIIRSSCANNNRDAYWKLKPIEMEIGRQYINHQFSSQQRFKSSALAHSHAYAAAHSHRDRWNINKNVLKRYDEHQPILFMANDNR